MCPSIGKPVGLGWGLQRLSRAYSRDGEPVMARSNKFVYDFAEGSKDMKDLLGGKGANLAEMTNMRLPVPPGFTISTEGCLTYLAEGAHPAGPLREVEEPLRTLEAAMGKRLGDAEDPLLVSVRSG